MCGYLNSQLAQVVYWQQNDSTFSVRALFPQQPYQAGFRRAYFGELILCHL